MYFLDYLVHVLDYFLNLFIIRGKGELIKSITKCFMDYFILF
jgi:hypothetical protein